MVPLLIDFFCKSSRITFVCQADYLEVILQLSRATNFIISFGRLKRSLDKGILEPEVYHMNPKKSNTKLFRKICRFQILN